jgi:hypothetical protein
VEEEEEEEERRIVNWLIMFPKTNSIPSLSSFRSAVCMSQ